MAKRRPRQKKEPRNNALSSFLILIIIFLGLSIVLSSPKKVIVTVKVPVPVRVPVFVKVPVPAQTPAAPVTNPPVAVPPKPRVPEKIVALKTPTPPKPAPVAKPTPPVKTAAVKSPLPPVKPVIRQKVPVAPKPVVPVKTVILPPKPMPVIPKITPGIKGKIAIVIDDWGYNLNNKSVVDEIHYPLTAAVLPNLAHTSDVVEELHRMGFEIILHLPMEPQERYNLEKDTVMTTLDESAVRNILNSDLKGLRYVRGVSNHQGSLATGDPTTMEYILKELRRRRLYFLDSFSSPNSVCFDVAGKTGVRFARRDVFLDNSNDPEYIRQQIDKLKLEAEQKGWAIGIGHDRKNTLEVLKEIMPELAQEGYKFVYVSELVE